jgi:hypothetical protein
MRAHWILGAILCLTLVPTASADDVQLSISSSALINVSSPNDNFWGTYYNVPALRAFSYSDPSISGGASVSVPNTTFSLPTGSVITGVQLTSVLLPTQKNPAFGTGAIVVDTTESPFGGLIDHSLVSVQPTFSSTGTSSVWAQVTSISGQTPFSGNELSTDNLIIQLALFGTIDSPLLSAGSNWAGYLNGSGQVDLPYTVDFDVTYTSAVPEPTTLALLTTGLLGLAAVYRRASLRSRTDG